jgi:hypothetical protein
MNPHDYTHLIFDKSVSLFLSWVLLFLVAATYWVYLGLDLDKGHLKGFKISFEDYKKPPGKAFQV